MFELIFYAILVGILISLLLIGPVFFLLVETSLTKGWRAAITLNLGVLVSDILCILVAYFGSKDLIQYIDTHPSLYMIGGFFIAIYGTYMFFTKPDDMHLDEKLDEKVPKKGTFSLFAHGFLLNMLNIGAIVFWFFIVSSIAIEYPEWQMFSLYMGIVLATFFGIDLIKIFVANRVKKHLNAMRLLKVRKILGIGLIIFGFIIFLKGFGVFDSIDQEIHNQMPISK